MRICVLGVLLALASLLGSAQLFSSLAGPPTTSILSRKLADFAAVKDEVDVIFLGSSLVHHHIDPGQFDAHSAAAGRPTRSYNLGVGGMGALETRYALERLRDLEPRRLRWLFLEQDAFRVDIEPENARSPRFVDWHTLPITWLALRLAWNERPPPEVRKAQKTVAQGLPLDADHPTTWQWRLHNMTDHVRAAVYRLLGIGRLRHALVDRIEGTDSRRRELEAWRASRTGPAGDGFVPLDWDISTVTDPSHVQRLRWRRADFNRRQVDYLQQARKAASRSDRKLPLTPTERLFFEEQSAILQRMASKTIYITNPVLSDHSRRLRSARDDGLVPQLFRFDDVREQRDLFDPKHRFDWNHLNAEGAQLYTNRLAQRFQRWLADADA